MRRCIVSLKYGTEAGKFRFTYGRQPAAAVATHRWNCERKAPDVEIPCGRDCGLWVFKGLSVPSRCGCNFLTGTAFFSSSPEFEHWPRYQSSFYCLLWLPPCPLYLYFNDFISIVAFVVQIHRHSTLCGLWTWLGQYALWGLSPLF